MGARVKYSEESWFEARRLFEEGYRLTQIEAMAGVPAKIVSMKSRRELWSREKRGYHKPNLKLASVEQLTKRCYSCGAKYEGKECSAIGHHEAHPEIASIYLREAA